VERLPYWPPKMAAGAIPSETALFPWYFRTTEVKQSLKGIARAE
jgi:hypothetical protein